MSAGYTRCTRRAPRRGLSLVEVLIALSISAMLLSAVAAAFSATAQAIEINDQFFRASQSARVSVNRISAELRKCRAAGVNGSTLALTSATGEELTYTFDATAKQLKLTVAAVPTPKVYVLANNVESVAFATDGRNYTVSIVVAVGTNRIALTGSALPRRSVTG